MGEQFFYRPAVGGGENAWHVDRLIELSAGLPAEFVALDLIVGGKPGEAGELVVLDPDGRLICGAEAVARARSVGQHEIRAVRFTALPEPDFYRR